MGTLVVGVTEDDQVFQPIIKAVAVYMVDMFITTKRATQMLLHDVAVYSNLLAIYFYGFISMGRLTARLKPVYGYVLGKVGLGKTFSGAVLGGGSPVGLNIKRGEANYASDSGPRFHNAIVTYIAMAKR